MLLINILLLCSSIALASVTPRRVYSEEPHDLKQYFEEFIVTHGKKYADEAEKNARFEIFKENVAKINKKNADPEETAIFGINQFADLTTEEFLQTYTGLKIPSVIPDVEYVNITRPFKAPATFDWREKGAVTRVKSQGRCGSCWTFGTSGAIEGAYALTHGRSIELSEQQILDCDTKNQGCHGGWMQDAVRYVVNAGGLEGEADYPYQAIEGPCRFDPSRVRAKVTKLLAYNLRNAEDTKQYLVQHGPITVAVACADWAHYDGHILMQCPFQEIDHAVLLVGYGSENGVDYWIVKNSWGTSWGNNGYIYIAYNGVSNPCHMYNPYAAGAQVA